MILAVDGKALNSASDLPTLVAMAAPGQQLALAVWRGGKLCPVAVTLGDAGKPLRDPTPKVRTAPVAGQLGLALRPLQSGERRAMGAATGLMVDGVSGRSQEAGMQAGDILLSINGPPVASVDQARAAVAGASRSAALLVQRGPREGLRGHPPELNRRPIQGRPRRPARGIRSDRNREPSTALGRCLPQAGVAGHRPAQGVAGPRPSFTTAYIGKLRPTLRPKPQALRRMADWWSGHQRLRNQPAQATCGRAMRDLHRDGADTGTVLGAAIAARQHDPRAVGWYRLGQWQQQADGRQWVQRRQQADPGVHRAANCSVHQLVQGQRLA